MNHAQFADRVNRFATQEDKLSVSNVILLLYALEEDATLLDILLAYFHPHQTIHPEQGL